MRLKGTYILQTYFVFIRLFSKQILTKKNKPCTKNSQELFSFAGSRFRGELKLPTPVLRFQPFISHLQWKPLYLLINSRVLDSPPHSLGQFTIWIWRKKWQSPYSSHYPQWKTARANVMASLKTLNKLLSTTVFIQPFIAAENMDA